MNTFLKNKYLFTVIISALLFIPFLGKVYLFDWDEINFAESAREMIVTDDYCKVQIAFKPFHEKPPLFIWMQVVSMKIFGVNEFSARFPNAICGIITLLFLLKVGSNYLNDKFGLYWIISFAGSILPFFYFKSGIIDPWFNLFIFSSIYLFFKNKLLLASISGSLAVLTKGPVSLILIFLTYSIYYLYNKKSKDIIKLIPFLLLSVVPYLLWYFLAYGFSPEILGKFISYHLKLMSTEDAGHAGPFYYHFMVLLIGVFPASFLSFRELFKSNKDDFSLINLILLIVVLLVFSIVKTKILHYSSLAYFPLTFFAAKFLKRGIFLKRAYLLTGLLGLILGLILIAFPFFINYVQNNPELIKDKFTREVIKADVSWDLIDSIGGFFLLISTIYYLIKKNYLYSFIGTILGFYFFMLLIAPKISKYTQNANIEFWKSQSEKEVYLATYSFKSYAHYFYGNIKPLPKYLKLNNEQLKTELINNALDYPGYFSVKFHKSNQYHHNPNLEFLYTQNGFSFFKTKGSNDTIKKSIF